MSDIPPVDVFRTVDKRVAESLANGSKVAARSPERDLVRQLDAIMLWDSKTGFNESFTEWDQPTADQVQFAKTVIVEPDEWITQLTKKNKLAMLDVLLDIREELQRKPDEPSVAILPNVIRFSELFPVDTIAMRDDYGGLRYDMSALLESHGIIDSLQVMPASHRWKQRMSLQADTSNIDRLIEVLKTGEKAKGEKRKLSYQDGAQKAKIFIGMVEKATGRNWRRLFRPSLA